MIYFGWVLIKIKSKLIVPLMDNEQLIGILTGDCSVKHLKSFTQKDIESIESIATFLINVLYKMYPSLQSNEMKIVNGGKKLEKSSKLIVKEIQQREVKEEKEKESISVDETLGFVAKTVHDIRTPANSLYGFLELLEDELENPRLLSYLSNAKESASYINDLTTSILDNISVQKECVEALPSPINPKTFFTKIVTNFSANMYRKEINFNVYVDPRIPKQVFIKPMILKRILMNLFSNAYKFTPTKKSITFSVFYLKEEKSLHISMEDTGIGISKERQEEIFKPYVQAQEDTKKEYGGTGLGLCICANYVKGLGGTLKLESQPDKGSTFTFDIPLEGEITEEVFIPISNKETKLYVLSSPNNHFTLENIKKNSKPYINPTNQSLTK